MNDNELSTAVLESVAEIHSATPVDHIIRRGHAVRARRRIPVAAGALTVAAGTALAVTTLLPASHPASHLGLSADHPSVAIGQSSARPGTARLAAWTVTKQTDGDIDVTVNQLKDPAGLQDTLRADRLPVNVSFSGRPYSASCQPYAASMSALRAVAQIKSDGLVIDPAALPTGIGLSIYDEAGTGLGQSPSGTAPTRGGTPLRHPPLRGPLLKGINGPLSVSLVYASQRCTG